MKLRFFSALFSAMLGSVLLLAAACGYDEGKDLPGVVERAAPADAELVGECGGSSGLIESPSRTCTYVVPGEPAEVTVAVADALAEQGFDVSCRGGGPSIEINGLRGDVRATAEITAGGSVVDSGDGAVNVFAPGYVPAAAKAIPARSVALVLSASRQSNASAAFWRQWIAGGLPCTEASLPRQTLAGCVEAWNRPENATNRRLALRELRVSVAYVFVRSERPGVASGCSFGFLAHEGRYLILDGSWSEGDLVFERPELGYASQRGLDADARVRPDGSLELKRPSLNDRCETWWNVPAGYGIREAAVRRRLAGEMEAVYTAGAEPRCTYTLRRGRDYLRGVLRFDHGEWAWTPLAPVEAPQGFRPNGELSAKGTLAVGP